MSKDIVACPREREENDEPRWLAKKAATCVDPRLTKREHPHERDAFRTEFQRDYTRIIHCRAFRRLRHKTQVFLSPQNDHICTRLEHSIYVASIARTISKALGLNNDLVAAIAVGHDLGHPPFGHEGERCLTSLRGKPFHHEIHSLRVVDILESDYPEHRGLNLTFAVRDGIVCHWGEGKEREIRPDWNKKSSQLRKPKRGARPATLEACVVRFADKIAYIGRDLEDAITAGVITRRKVPRAVRTVLGDTNGKIIGTLIHSIWEKSYNEGSPECIVIGEDVHKALGELYVFSQEETYGSPKVTEHFGKVHKAARALYRELVDVIAQAREKEDRDLKRSHKDVVCLRVLMDFLVDDVREWRQEKPEQLAIDFMAGMTDGFFTRAFTELFLPMPTI